MNDFETIGHNARTIRRALGLTQSQVCERIAEAGAGVLHVPDLSRAERGHGCSMGTFRKIAAGLGVGLHQLTRPVNGADRRQSAKYTTSVQSSALIAGGCK